MDETDEAAFRGGRETGVCHQHLIEFMRWELFGQSIGFKSRLFKTPVVPSCLAFTEWVIIGYGAMRRCTAAGVDYDL